MPIQQPTITAAVIRSIQSDPRISDLINGAKMPVFYDNVPPTEVSPWVYVKMLDSEEIRNSENKWHLRQEVLSISAFGEGGDMPWAIIDTIRQIMIPSEGENVALPLAGSDSDESYPIKTVCVGPQNLVEAPYTSQSGKKVLVSTRVFSCSMIRKGGI